jgi:hypothetical protein
MSDQMSGQELVEYNRKFKRAILDVLFRLCDTFYMHCMPNPLLHIGKRGLVDKEKTDGIILVFGPYSTRHLSWDDNFIHCEMQFGRWEKVSLPYECVARMFDKSGQVIMQWATLVAPESHREIDDLMGKIGESGQKKIREREKKGSDARKGESKIIEIDFTKKRDK